MRHSSVLQKVTGESMRKSRAAKPEVKTKNSASLASMEVKCRECSVIRLARCYSVYRKTMRLLFRLGLLLAGAVSTSYAGQRVVEDAGRLILEDSSGTRTVLTKGGMTPIRGRARTGGASSLSGTLRTTFSKPRFMS
jgi:hypothetical protein